MNKKWSGVEFACRRRALDTKKYNYEKNEEFGIGYCIVR